MIAATLLLIASLLVANAPDNPDTRRYQVRSGIVKATMDMMGEQEVTIYFEDYGRRQAVHTSMSMDVGGTTRMMQQVAITDRQMIVNYDPIEKTGIRSPAPTGTSGPGGDPTNMSFSVMSKADKKKYNYKRMEPRRYLERETFGHRITVEGMTMKVWTWRDIPLYMEISNAQMPKPIVMRTLSIETDIELPPETFMVPPDVTIVDAFSNPSQTPLDR